MESRAQTNGSTSTAQSFRGIRLIAPITRSNMNDKGKGIALLAPMGIQSSYSLVFPTAHGTAGQVLAVSPDNSDFLVWATPLTSASGWSISGNILSDSTTTFLGTPAQAQADMPLILKTDGNERMRITGGSGFIGIGTATPQAQLEVDQPNGSSIGLIVRSVNNPSANIFEIHNNSAVDLFTIGPTGALNLKPHSPGSGNTNQLRFYELAANGQNYVGFKAPDNIASNLIWTLPAAAGTEGQFLVTSATGALSWITLPIPYGTANNSTVRWDGTTWVEQKNMRNLADGSLEFGSTTSSAVSTPIGIDMGGTFGSDANPSRAKLKILNDSTGVYGFGATASSLNSYAPAAATFRWYSGTGNSPAQAMSLTSSRLTLPTNVNLSVNGVDYTWPSAQGASGTVLRNDGFGVLTWIPVNSVGWTTSGNAGLTGATNSYLGTSDNNTLSFRTNAVERVQITGAGAITMTGGASATNTVASSITLVGGLNTSGTGGSSGGGAVILRGGATTNGPGGNVEFYGGTSTNGTAGSVILGAAGGTEVMRVDATQNVGIGITSPTSKLHVLGTTAINTSGSATTTIGNMVLPDLTTQNAQNTDNVVIVSAAGVISQTSRANLVSGTLWSLSGSAPASSWNGSAGSYLGTTNNQPLVLATTANAAQDIIFYTGASGASERMRILGTGNIGIGFTAPTSALHIDRGNATASYLQFTAGTTTNRTATDGFDIGIDASGNAVLNQQENLPIIISTNSTERMRITGAGDVTFAPLATALKSSVGSNDRIVIANASGVLDQASIASVVAAGVTGSFVDLSTAQTVGGAKTFSAISTFNAGATFSGAATNINASSNFATNINTGTSTGLVTIGNTSNSTTIGSSTVTISTVASATAKATTGTNDRVIIANASGQLDQASFSAFVGASSWVLAGNSTADAWNGSAGSRLGTTSLQPLVLATTNATAQDIRFYTGASGANERLRITGAGDIVVGSGDGTTAVSGLTLRGPDASGSSNLAGSTLNIRAGIGTGSGGSGAIIFSTAAASSGGGGPAANISTERLRITPAGQVNIGNGLSSATPTAGIIMATDGSGTNIAGADFQIQGGRGTGSALGGAVTFYTSPAGTSGTGTNALAERMRITGAGNVLIGNNNGTNTLDVTGTFGASGNSTIGGTLGVTGAATLSSTLGVTGLITGNGGATIVGATSINATGTAATTIGNTTAGTAVTINSGSTGGLTLGGLTAGSASDDILLITTGNKVTRMTQANFVGGTSWSLTGNATTNAWNGTASSGSYLGTTSAQPLVLATTNATAQDIRFFTGANGATERLRITGSGTINIGNGIASATPTTGVITVTDGSGTNIAGADFQIQSGRSTGTATGGAVTFFTSPASGVSGATTNNYLERMRINGAGSVLIGNTNGTNTLDVTGTFAASGNSTIGGTLGVTGAATMSGGATVTGTTNINTTGSSATNIGTGATAGTVSIGRSGGTITTIGAIGHTGTITSSGLITGSAGATISGAAASINSSSNFNTDINTGSSTGTVAIGNAASTTNVLGATNINTTGTAATTIGNTSASTAVTINSGSTGGLTLGGVPSGSASDDVLLITSGNKVSRTTQSSLLSNSGWALSGNSISSSSGALGVAPVGSYLGTTSASTAKDLRIATNGLTRMIVASDGAITMGGTLGVTGATTLSSALTVSAGGAAITGNSTITGTLTTQTATGTDDQLILQAPSGGAARFAGTITSADLTAARTYTLPDLTGTIAVTANNLGAFAATTSSQLAGVISDETGTGGLVFASAPTVSNLTVSSGGAAITGNTTINTTGSGTTSIGSTGASVTIGSVSGSVKSTVTGNDRIVLSSSTGSLDQASIASVVQAGLSGQAVTSFSAGTTGLTPSSTSTGNITLGGTLNVANGGTGATTLSGLLIGNAQSAFTATTTSSGIAGAITDETGSGALVFATSPSVTTLTVSSGGLTVTAGGASVTGTTTINSSGSAGTTIGNASSTNTIAGTTGITGNTTINTTGSGTTTIGNASSTNTIAGATGITGNTTINTTGSGTTSIGSTGASVTIGSISGSVKSSVSSNDRIVLATSTGSLDQASIASVVQAGLSGQAVTSFSAGSTGFTPSSASTGNVTLTGTLNASNGGTGLSSYTSGDLLYATGATTLARLGLGSANTVLRSNGTAPVWGQVILTSDVTGILPIANGGTGSSTQNFVDLTTTQTVGGAKTFSALGTFSAGAAISGAATSINASSNFATNINTGTSTAGVTIGNTANTVTIGSIGTTLKNTVGSNDRVVIASATGQLDQASFATIIGQGGWTLTGNDITEGTNFLGTTTSKRLEFRTSGTERMRISATGNVVFGSGDSTTTVTSATLRGPDAVGSANLAGSNLSLRAGTGTGSGGSGAIIFSTAAAGSGGGGPSANTSSERMRITPSGLVLIGNSNGTNTLDVTGTFAASGNSTVGGTLGVTGAVSLTTLNGTATASVPVGYDRIVVANNTGQLEEATIGSVVAAGLTGNAVTSFSGGTTGLTPATASTGAVTLAGTLAVANGGTGVTTSTGTGSVVLSNSPTLVTPALGTPSAAVLTNATGLPITTGVSGLGTNVATMLATPSSANLAAAITDETGSGALVFGTSPTIATPAITFSTTANVTAGTNAQGQGALSNDYNVVTTANNNPSGVTLPTAAVGRRIIVVNRGVNTVNIYPASGAAIDGLAANASIALPASGYMELNASSATQWYSTNNLSASGAAVTSISGGTTGLTPSSPTTGAVTLGGTLAAANGGTGLSSYTAGDLLYATGSTTLAKLGIGAANRVLRTSGSAPSWSQVDLTTDVTGTLPVGNGGTGAATLTGMLKGNGTSAVAGITGTTGGVTYWSDANTIAASAAGSSGQALVSGATGAPTWFAPTQGSVIFAGASGALAQSNANLFWDNTNSRLGIGDATPAAALTVGSGDLFQVNTSGAIAAVTGITTTGGYTQSGSGANTLSGATTLSAAGTALTVTNNASIGGTLSVAGGATITGTTTINSTGAAATTIGNTGASVTIGRLATTLNASVPSGADRIVLASSTGSLDQASIASVLATGTVTSFSAGSTGLTPSTGTTGAVTLSGTLNVANGGTGATTLTGMLKGNGTSAVTGITGSAGGVTYWSDANTIAASAVGTSGQALVSGATGAPTWFAPTQGSVIFAGASGVLAQSNANLFWDNTNSRLGIGDATPAAPLTVGANDAFQVSSTGAISTSGGYTQSGSSANTLTGATTLSAAGTALTVTNAASIGGTLGVTGASTFTGLLTANSGATIAGTTGINVTGTAATTIGNTSAATTVAINTGATTGLVFGTTGITSGTASDDVLLINTTSGRVVRTPRSNFFGGSLSSLTAATASNTIDNANFSQTWQWNTLGSGSGLVLSSTSTAAAANTQTLLDIQLSGANATATQTTYGATISNTHTGATSTNVALELTASGGINNYALIAPAGNVGIGTTAPTNTLQVNGTLLTAGGAVSINDASNFATNINTGSSTGAVTIGGTGTQTISIGNGAGVKTVNLGSSNTTSATTILSGSGGVSVNASNNQPTNINTGTSTGAVTIGNTTVGSTVTIGSLGRTLNNTIGSNDRVVVANASGQLDQASLSAVVASGTWVLAGNATTTAWTGSGSGSRLGTSGTFPLVLATTNATAQDIQFWTGSNGANERMRIAGSGDVIFGSGEGLTTFTTVTLRAPDAGGSGTTGPNLSLRAGNGTGSGTSGAIIFSTSPANSSGAPSNANTVTERMRITPAGQVNIGNGLSSATPTAGIIMATDGSGTNIAGADFQIQGGRGTGTALGGAVTFFTSATGASGTATNALAERMRITGAGNVLIGNVNGTNTLDVTGTFGVSGNSIIGGTVGVTGAATLSSTLGVTGLITGNGGATIVGATSINATGTAATTIGNTTAGTAVTINSGSTGGLTLGGLTAGSASDDVLLITSGNKVTRMTQANFVAGTSWSLTGNATTNAWTGTAGSGSYIGTTSAQPLVLATTNATAQDIRFFTGANGATERLRITGSGTINIGNGISSATPTTGVITVTDGSGTNIAGADFQIQAGRSTGTATGGAVTFFTTPASGVSSSTSNNYLERMRINGAGSVLIGSTAGSNTLDVTGTFGASGNSTIGGTLGVTGAATMSGGATVTGTLTTQTSTATQDQILLQAAATGAARFAGTITNADLTATRTYTLPDASGTVALLTNNLGAFAATTSAQLLPVISDETGSGALVFATSPALTSPTITGTTTINDNSNNNTSINTGSSTGTLAIGNAASTTNVLGATTINASGNSNTTIGNATTTGTTTIATNSTTGRLVISGLPTGTTDDVLLINASNQVARVSQSSLFAGQGWSISGNSISSSSGALGVAPVGSFLGTTSASTAKDLRIATNGLTRMIVASDGAITMGGTLGVTGATTLSSTLGVTGAATLSSTLGVSGLITGSAGATISGAATSINSSSNFNTDINTGSSTGVVAIGNASSTTNMLGTTNVNASGSSATNIGTGANAGTVTIGRTSGTITTIGAIGHTGTITSSGLITGSAGATISGATTSINDNSNNTTNINTGTSTGALNLGSSASTTTVLGTVNINTSGSGATSIGTGASAGAVSIGRTGGTVTMTGTLGQTGTTTINSTGTAATTIGATGSTVTIGSIATTLKNTIGSNDRIVLANSSGTLDQASIATVLASGAVTSFSAGSTGLTPSTGTTGAVTLAGTLNVANGGTGATSLTGVMIGNGTSAVTASTTSSGIAGAISDETGSGALVFGTSPTVSTLTVSSGGAAITGNSTVTGTLTTQTATSSDDQIIVQAQAGGAARFAGTITSADLTSARTYTLPNSTGTVALTANTLGDFAATTSAQLAGVISDETGSGALVFGTSPTVTTLTVSSGGAAITGNSSVTGALNLSGASSPLQANGSAGTAGQVLTSAGAGATPTWTGAQTAAGIKTKGRSALLSAVTSYAITGANIDANDGISVTLEADAAGAAMPTYYVVRAVGTPGTVTVYFSSGYSGYVTWVVID